MKDKRLVDRLTDYWNRLRSNQEFPEYGQINPSAIADVWDSCLVLEVESHVENKNTMYVYRHMGTEILDAYGNDLTGQYVNVHMHNFPGWQVLKSVDKVLAKPEISLGAGSFINHEDRVIKYRACLLPFGKNKHVTHVVVGISWKAF